MINPPIIVVEKDDGDIRFYDSPDDKRLQQDIEAIDLKNNEYLFYDSTGRAIRFRPVTVKRPVFFGLFSASVESIEFDTADATAEYADELRQALIRFLSNHGIDSPSSASLEKLINTARAAR